MLDLLTMYFAEKLSDCVIDVLTNRVQEPANEKQG